MTSLAAAIRNAKDRRQMPAFPPGDIGALARALNLSPPVSIAKGLIPALNALPFAVITRTNSAIEDGSSTAHASAQVGLQSDGKASFRGQVKENGIVGHNYLVTATLSGVKDASGATLVFAQTGNVAGSLTIGKDHSEFQIDTSSQVIADQWDLVKTVIPQFRLHTTVDPFQLTEGFLGTFLVLGLVKLLEAAAGGIVSCQWDDSEDGGEDGEMHQCSGPDDGGNGDGGVDGGEDG